MSLLKLNLFYWISLECFLPELKVICQFILFIHIENEDNKEKIFS